MNKVPTNANYNHVFHTTKANCYYSINVPCTFFDHDSVEVSSVIPYTNDIIVL